MSINKSITKSAGIIGIATLLSRILGFIRDIVIARMFGVYMYAQVFVIAFKIPNLFRDFVGEGAVNSAIVPVFTEYKVKHSPKEFWELANVVLNLLLIMLMAITLLGMLFSPIIVRFIAPGFIAFPEKLEATVRLTRIIFPYILLISLAAYSMGLLNSLKHFTVPAFAPCLLNISLIVFAMLFGEGIKGLALGVLAGGILQLAIQIPVLYRKGFRLRLFHSFKHPAAGLIGKLMIPRVLSTSIYQLNNFVDSIFGSLAWIVGEGAVAVLYFSYRLVLFPLGIFSNSLSQAMLPVFSAQALDSDHGSLKHTLSWGLRSTFFVMLPASAGFMVLAYPLVYVLFGGGRFDLNSVYLTSNALFFYSLGLFAYGGTKILQSCFFAMKDTKTPAKVSALALVMNIVLNGLLMFPLKAGGLALATSLSGISSFIILFVLLSKKLGGIDKGEIVSSFLRILVASIGMGFLSWFLYSVSGITECRVLVKVIRFGFIIFISAAAYFGFCFLFRVREMRELFNWLMRKR